MMGSRYAAWLLLVGITLAIGFHPLSDLDLGWHIAGGLKLLEEGRVPRADPFTVGGVPWISYSWFPELIFAVVYRRGGFEWLRVLQWLFIYSSMLAIFALASSRVKGRACDIGALFAVVLALPLLVPFWHLRPQLLSVMFFAVGLLLLERRALTFPRALILTVVWASCHIYWVFVPALWALYRGTEREARVRGLSAAALLFAAGAISPYGIANLAPVFEYALDHQIGYLLIDEFQPLIRAPFEMSCFVAAILVMLFAWRGEHDGRLKLLLIVFALCSLLQRKYLPLFAVVWVVLVAERIEARLKQRVAGDEGSLPVMYALVFCVAVVCVLPRTPSLAPRFQELLTVFRDRTVVEALARDRSPRTFNHFDDGGWLALASTLSPQGFLTSIDGRTLVAGPVRLAEFHRLLTGDDAERCTIFMRSRSTLAVVPLTSNAFRRLFATESARACESGWQPLVRGTFYEIWGPSPTDKE